MPHHRHLRIAACYGALLLGFYVVSDAVPAVAWVALGVSPPLLLSRGLRNPERDAFTLVKTASVLVAAWLILAAGSRAGEPLSPPWRWALVGVFAANILEAVASDVLRRRWVTGLAGLLLLLTIPGPERLHLATGNVLYDAPLAWIAAYTAWNWAFVAGRTPRLVAAHTGVLGAALAVGLWSPAHWGEARALTLAAHQLFAFGGWDRYPVLWIDARPGGRVASEPTGALARISAALSQRAL